MRLLISACFLGVNCRYDGSSNALPKATIEKLKTKFDLIPICPEIYGGLPTPRAPAERTADRIMSKDGSDVTDCFVKGSEIALKFAQQFNCQAALFKERSPSCGCGKIYDGTFSGNIIAGDGIVTELLKKNGVRVYGESKINELMDDYE